MVDEVQISKANKNYVEVETSELVLHPHRLLCDRVQEKKEKRRR